MKLLVISSAPFVAKSDGYAAYSPYIKEMAIWAKYADKIAFFCPIWKQDNQLLISPVDFPISKLFEAKEFNIKSAKAFLLALWFSFYNFYKLFESMMWADHIHLRCPGNIGLMGCIVQIFFPWKPKTAKYAGNWDPKAKQPWSYKLQRWILSNTLLTKNMQVLVYGEWENQTKNIKSFFTASYRESDKIEVSPRNLNMPIAAVFVGTLSSGKRPLYAIKLVEALRKKGINISLSLYGHGKELHQLQVYISEKKLEAFIAIKGNHPLETLKKVYQESHFVLLPSESEGWPKVVAEGMFWGCVPMATKVSCLRNMLDNGHRGLLLDMNFESDLKQITDLLNNRDLYRGMAENSMRWSRKYTLDLFEDEIKSLLRA